MPFFRTEETLACWVTFKNVVEAPNADAARDFAYQPYEGDDCKAVSQEIVTEIGDTIDGYDRGIKVIEVKAAPQIPLKPEVKGIIQGLKALAEFHAGAEVPPDAQMALDWINELVRENT